MPLRTFMTSDTGSPMAMPRSTRNAVERKGNFRRAVVCDDFRVRVPETTKRGGQFRRRRNKNFRWRRHQRNAIFSKPAERFEQDRCRDQGARLPRYRCAIRPSDPNADDVATVKTDRPSVAVTI